MKREFLFRGKDENDNWHYGDLVHDAFDGTSKNIAVGIRIPNCYPVEVIPETVGQFTGMIIKTSPEVKVFVGDRVLVRGTKRIGLYETTVIESPFGFTLETNKTNLVDGSCLLAISKVVGTIHDNPYLLI